jgi:WD40 repeat protein
LVTDDDQTARLWDLATGASQGGPLRHAWRVFAAAFSPDGQSFLTGEEERTVRLWRLAPGRQFGPTMRACGSLFGACYAPDGKTILAGDRNGFVYLWNARTNQIRLPPLRHKDQTIHAVAFRPDGNRILASGAGLQGLVRQFDASTGELVGPVLACGPVKAVAWSPDGKTILTGSWSYFGAWSGVPLGAQRWDAASGMPIGPFLKHRGDVWAVSYSPDGGMILTGSADRTVRFWNAVTGEAVGEPLVHPAEVWSAVFSPDGKLVLTGCRDRLARVWEIATGRMAGNTLPHTSEVRTVAFSPDGQLILTGCRDGFARLWDFQTRSDGGAQWHIETVDRPTCRDRRCSAGPRLGRDDHGAGARPERRGPHLDR